MFFAGGMAQANRSVSRGSEAIEVLDLQPSAFKDLLEYIYTEEHVELKLFDQVCQLSNAAKKYVVPNLMERCLQFTLKNLTKENVCRALEFANLYEDTTLKEHSLNLIRCNTRESLFHPEFENIIPNRHHIVADAAPIVFVQTAAGSLQFEQFTRHNRSPVLRRYLYCRLVESIATGGSREKGWCML